MHGWAGWRKRRGWALSVRAKGSKERIVWLLGIVAKQLGAHLVQQGLTAT
jgi:hypothetical protein